MEASSPEPARPRVTAAPRNPAAYVAELLGTFVLVLFISSIYAVHSAAGLGVTDWAVVGLLHAFVLLALVATLGRTSGAHLNPAVTLAHAAMRRITPPDAAVYVLLQLAGAVAGALVSRLLFLDEGAAPVDYGATTVSEPFLQGDVLPGMLAELIGAFVLVWAYMAYAANGAGTREWGAVVIGATLGFVVMAFGPLTGAGVNPARSFGPAIVSGEFGGAGDFLLVYVLAPVLGGLLAAVAHKAIVADQRDEPAARPVDRLP